MKINITTYVAGNSTIHTCDARVKIILLIAYSILLFLIHAWWALGVCAALFLILWRISGVPGKRALGLSVPLIVIAVLAIVFNSFSLNASAALLAGGLGAVSAGMLASVDPILISGSFGFVPAGFARGCFYAVRIILLVVASLLISFTTTSTALTQAFASFLKPLRLVKVPVDDIASILSVALRFIPLVAEEMMQIHDAQWSRGAKFSEEGLVVRLRAWATVLVPLFVGMFRKADNLATAMDARCYGIPGIARTSLYKHPFGVKECGIVAVGLVLFAILAIVG